MNMTNHEFHISTTLMRTYFNTKDPIIKKWSLKYELTMCWTRHSNTQTIVVQSMDESDAKEWRQDIESVFNGEPTLSTHEDAMSLLTISRRLMIPIKNRSFYIDNTLRDTYITTDDPGIQQWLKDNKITISTRELDDDGIKYKYEVTIDVVSTPVDQYNLWTVVSVNNNPTTKMEEYALRLDDTTPLLDQSCNGYMEVDECNYESDIMPLLGLRHRSTGVTGVYS